ncbi:multidrug effflux MFS transporter [Cellulomonas aerilata]|uniref:Bcr/CflA family drug resistance efflux transporter n=1 Tax=Cellulomonas aerilata TaxID=515326 RepID=A0A512D7J6_9CELL|nr:multidrug effflux MFS transporter [Cellulomonas aerilata]GEO32405.1 Bcr/CflA family drug resistance efflux transporter [Cellulomonas aerilata]
MPQIPARTRISAGLILLLSALTAIGPLTFDTYLAAFPQIAQDLSASRATVQLTLTASLAGLALGQVLIGSLSDTFGRRRPLLGGLSLYVLVSAALIFVDSIALFTALRFVQGFSAAAGMVLSMAILRDSYEGLAVSKAMARLMLVVGVAPVLAPTLGAQLLRFGSWRMIFGFLTVAGVLLLALAARRLQETLPVERRRTGGTVAALRTYRDLLLDRGFLGLALLSAFYMGALFTYVSGSTFVFQDGFGLDPQQFGYVFASGAVAITIASQVYGALVDRFRPEQILTVAVIAGLVLSATLVAVAASGAGLVPVLVLLVLTLSTAGLVMPSAPAIALDQNPHRAGSAAALLGALQFGMGAAIAPVTGLVGGSPATAMALVMALLILVSALLLLAVSRGWRRTRRATAALSVPGAVAPEPVGSGTEASVVTAPEAQPVR